MDIDPRLRPSDHRPQPQPPYPHPHPYPHSPSSTSISKHPYRPSTTSSSQTAPSQPNPYTTPLPYLTATTTTSPTQEDHHDHDHDHDPKRPRACEACRQLKVRCEPNPSTGGGEGGGPCKRCAKARRNCIVTAPSRKRAKKTDSRVAELERKIDALTASLRSHSAPSGEGGSQGGSQRGSQGQGQIGEQAWGQVVQGKPQDDRRWLGNGLAGTKRLSTGEVKDVQQADEEPKTCLWQEKDTKKISDVIDRGFLDVEAANLAFDRYVNDMAPHLPVVVFPPGTKMEDIRRTKPILLHAILSVSIAPIRPSVQSLLVTDFYKQMAERAVVNGEKSLELVQAIIVSWIWYMPPDHFEDLKFYTLIHMAVVMGMDIGMNRPTLTNKMAFNLLRHLIGKKPSSLNPDAPETRRAWLGCYFGSVHVSTALRRALLVRWLPYMDESIEILENSPDALPSDKTLIDLARLTRLSEEIGFQFFTDDPGSNASFSDPKVQYTIKAFEKQLLQWRGNLSPESYSPLMRQSEHTTNIFMHETAMHVDAPNQPEEVSAAHIGALTSCLTSVQEAIDAICSIDVKSLTSMPTVALARTSYAAVALVKLYSLASTADSKIGQVIDPASLRVEHHLDRVINHYKVAGEQIGGRTPAKFSTVLSLLRNWFVKRKDQNPALREAFGVPRQEEQAQTQTQTQKNTPLHLLSEVAMDPNRQYPRPETEAESWANYQSQSQPTESRPFYPMQQHPQYPDMSTYDTTGMLQPEPCFVPELGVQMGFYPENLFALGNMLDEGFFNLPFGYVGDGGGGGGGGGFYQ